MNETAKKLREVADRMGDGVVNSAPAIIMARKMFDVRSTTTFGGDLGNVLTVIADELDELQARATEANNLRQQLKSAEDKAERRKKHIGYLETALHDKNALLEQRGGTIARLTAECSELRKQVPTERERQILDMWPRFEDGEPVMPGDKVHYSSAYNDETEIEVESITAMDGCFVLCDDECRSNQYEQGQRVKRPVQSVLDADGVEIKVGDTVWFATTGRGGFRVDRIERRINGFWALEQFCDGTVSNSGPVKVLTHTRPDSWERLEEDAEFNDETGIVGGNLDLIRRAKALAEAEVGR